MCHGDNDPDWEYVLRGACFGFRVIDQDCVSSYFPKKYSSITHGDIGVRMVLKVSWEISEGLLKVVDKPCVCPPIQICSKGTR